MKSTINAGFAAVLAVFAFILVYSFYVIVIAPH